MLLTEKELQISGHLPIRLDDIAGCRVENGVDGASTSTVVVENFPLVRNRRSHCPARVMFSSKSDAEEFCADVRKSIRKKLPPHLLSKKTTDRVLLLINPFSGQKRADKLWRKYGSYVLKAAGICTDVVSTEYPKHATRIMQELNIDLYDAVIVNSGDGLITEVIHGLLLRKDRERALKFPICHVPGGTSNALAAAICYACNEPFSTRDVFITECCLMATRPRYIPLRLYNVETQYDGTRPMFMSATWGLIADIDLGSERFRWAGMIRLHIEAVLRIAQLPTVATYRARVSYIPVQCRATSRNTMLRHYSAREEFGTGHFDYEEVGQASGLEKEESEHFSSIEQCLEGTSLTKIPRLDQPLDESWQTVEGDWVTATISTLSHLGSDIPFLPSARLDEPIMYLTLIDWNTVKTRLHVAHLFTFMEGSKHLAHPCMQIIPVKAARIVPITKGGYFAIDGEPCKSGSSFQVVPNKYCATVVGRKEVIQAPNSGS